MARRRDRDGDLGRELDRAPGEDLERAQRENPYDQLPMDDTYDDAYDDDAYEQDDEEEMPRSRVTRGSGAPLGGLLGTPMGRILLAVIALLLVLLIGLAVYGALAGGLPKGEQQDQQTQGGQLSQDDNAQGGQLPQGDQLPEGGEPVFAPEQGEPDEALKTPQPVIFAPIVNGGNGGGETGEPTQAPERLALIDEPTPEPTETPLPIILSNTPTPRPSPTPTPSPSPTLEPTPTPTPSPTPVRDLAKGETNRQANLRESADPNAKVKQAVKKGQAVTIHETILDGKGRIWYALTVDDLAVDGWMRDYVVDVQGEIAKPTATPKPEATEKPDRQQTSAPEGGEAGLGTGKTSKDANIRKIMNGKVLTTLRKNKRVSILDVRLDKNGKVWYQVQPEGSETVGFVRDYLITLDKGVTLPTPEGAKTATPQPETEGEDTAEPTQAPQEDVLSREVVGKARTNREANVRSEPKGGSKVVRQLSKGLSLHILGKYKTGEDIWYEVATESGKTYGFVRDYVIDVIQLDKGVEEKAFESK